MLGSRLRVSVARLTACSALVAGAQIASGQQAAGPAVQAIDRITARAEIPFASVPALRTLSNGSVLVNDVRSRRLVLLDERLHLVRSVSDTSTSAPRRYAGGVGLVPYVGDSSLYVDRAAGAIVVISPSGELGRIMTLTWPPLLTPSREANGYFYYTRASHRPAPAQPRSPDSIAAQRGRRPPADSSYLVREALTNKRIDTLGVLLNPRTGVQYSGSTDSTRKDVTWLSAGSRGGVVTNTKVAAGVYFTTDPVPTSDDWVVLSSGTVAIVRASDYHIELLAPDGQLSSTVRIAHRWQRLTDSAKHQIIDSLTALSPRAAFVGGYEQRFVDANDLPDYVPAFRARSTLADAENHLWMRTDFRPSSEGGGTYEVLSTDGKIIGRYQIPGGSNIAGFAVGAVYLVAREGTTYSLVRATIPWR